MLIAILNDTHLGIRNSSDIFLDNASKFYTKTFFPFLMERGIKQIIHLGDYYDNRKAINIKALNDNRKYFLEPMRELGIRMDIIPGNHDTYFKDTNTPNSLKEFKKIVNTADVIYGEVSLNAATKIPARVKKKSVLEYLDSITNETLYMSSIGYYGDLREDKKGRKILKVL